MMKVQLTFLGTSGSVPTKNRNLSALALHYAGQTMLFDCSEGSQQQFMRTGISYMKIKYIFLSHFHADHWLGLPGIVATMNIHGRTDPLIIYGPPNVAKKIDYLLRGSNVDHTFPIECREVKNGVIVKEKDFSVKAVRVNHTAVCFGYIFESAGRDGVFLKEKAKALGIPEGPLYSKLYNGKSVKVAGKTITPKMVMDYSQAKKGIKISYIVDTFPDKMYVKAIEGSDLLVHEATFLHEKLERAKETKHSTARLAAEIAKKAKVKKLILTHFSPRLKNVSDVENEAKAIFPNTVCAEELMKLEL